MIVKLADWRFQVDLEATRERTAKNASDHCNCSYCRNYYEAVELAHPGLKGFLSEFGIHIQGPSELMPFEPTLMMACYRVQGRIIQWGSPLLVYGIPVVPEAEGDERTFLLWVGELEVPWLQQEKPDDVVSPANLPEFLSRMREIWNLRHERNMIYS